MNEDVFDQFFFVFVDYKVIKNISEFDIVIIIGV